MGAQPDLAAMRRAYARAGLEEGSAPGEPLALFVQWFNDAVSAGLPEPNAMVLATATRDGAPNARTVLLKGMDERGFTFFTNVESAKGRELAANPRAALVFPWHGLERQVRVTGTVTQLDRAEVAAYFATRPRGSQLGAWASPQSQVITGRDEIERRLVEVTERFPDGATGPGGAEAAGGVPVPDFWGGYRVAAEVVEFWAGRDNRLHDRLRYRLSEDLGWVRERLAP